MTRVFVMNCQACKTTNRDKAIFCKQCGVKLLRLSASVGDDLIGMEDIKKTIADLASVMAAVKNDGLSYSDRLHTVIIGNTGTGKTKLVQSLASLFHKHGVIKDDTPVILDAVDYATFAADFEASFKKAKGKVLCIENVQKLIPAGYSQSVEQLDRVFREMSKPEYRLDPIIVLSGQPSGFREYLNANDSVKSKFRFVFTVPDFDSTQLCQCTAKELTKSGFSLTVEAEDKLRKMFQKILKESKQPGTDTGAQNAWLALKTAEEIKSNYYLRAVSGASSGKVITPDDIKGRVDEEKSLDAIVSEIDSLVGMQGIKTAIRGLIDEISVQKERAQEGIGKEQTIAFHVVLTGNPGTGKTTVARKLGEIFKSVGILDIGHVVEVDRSKIVAQYVGQTAPQVNQLCDDALGGILFIDEAYTLKQSDSDSFGQEAIDTLLKRMEDDRGKFIVVIAGYPKEIGTFLNSNPGLQSRFDKRYHFSLEDYNAAELTEIFKRIAEHEKYCLDEDAVQKIQKQFAALCANKDKSFGNGREARNLFEACRAMHSKRISLMRGQEGFDRRELSCFRAEDIPASEKASRDISDSLTELDKLIGLDVVKQEVRNLVNYLQVDKIRSEQGGKETKLNIHFVFRGNPGTGKTTVARILAEVFKSMGLLSRGHLVEVDRSGLVAQYLGQTAAKTCAVIDSAMGGVLFVDEAYTLSSDTFGKEAIDTLLKRMEDDKGKFIVIAAGYFAEMDAFLNSNSGLTSRFTKFIDFPDYTPDEMQAIFMGMVGSKGMSVDTTAVHPLEELFHHLYQARDANFANGRTVRNLFEKSLQNQSARIAPLVATGNKSAEILNVITLDDIPCQGGNA